MLLPANVQHRALVAYLGLLRLRPDWQRHLVLLDAAEDTAPFAFAARITGAAVLWTTPDAAALRAANQQGLTDFNVTTLPEAVRILKNEVRKGTPVAVGLLDKRSVVWDEIVVRGLQPQALLAASTIHQQAGQSLTARGAFDLSALSHAAAEDILTNRAANWRERRAEDEALLLRVNHLPEPDRIHANRWLTAAPRLFPRDGERCFSSAWSASNPHP